MGNIRFAGDATYWGSDLNYNLYPDFETAAANWRTQTGAITSGDMENQGPAQSLSKAGWLLLWGSPHGQAVVFLTMAYYTDQNITFNAQGKQAYAQPS